MRQISMRRIACVLLLGSASSPAMSQTQVIRRANTARTQLETAGSERLAPLEASEIPAAAPALPSVAVPATPAGPRTVESGTAAPRTIEFAAPNQGSENPNTVGVSPEVLARWHVRNNLCSQQYWSLQEFQLLFPAITPEMIRQVCES